MRQMMRTQCNRCSLLTLCVLLLWGLQPDAARPSECDSTSKGFAPLTEMSAAYMGEAGGLYPGGANAPPPVHDSVGLALASGFVPLDTLGLANADGAWVLLSVGMSNTTQEFSRFVSNLSGDTTLHEHLRIVDGAQGGQAAERIKYDTARFWTVIEQRLSNLNLSPLQVQAVWMKQANPGPTDPFPGHALTLKDDIAEIIRIAKVKYPNLRQLFLSSRIYAGYASTGLNPEPFAYESAFTMRWLIESQINGDTTLNHLASAGPVVAPWLAWGPYLWADGIVPRQEDGLQWFCSDLNTDGTHPSSTGREKVAGLLETFFKTSPYTTSWFLAAPGGDPTQIRGDVNESGDITAADIITMVGVIFKGFLPTYDPILGDVNCTGATTSADIIYMVNYLFKSGPEPCPL